MPLTPIDVTQQTFRPSLRGYDEGEVDGFLDKVVESMKDYDQRLRDADERVAVLEEQLQANRESENAMRRAFVAAQRAADEIVAEARVEGEGIVAEAEAKAAQVSTEKIQERDALAEELRGLQATVRDLRSKMVAIASGTVPQLEELESEFPEDAAPATSRPSPDRSGSLAARVAELSPAEEVADHIPPFATGEFDAVTSVPIEMDDDPTPTEEVPRFGAHRPAEPSPFAGSVPEESNWPPAEPTTEEIAADAPGTPSDDTDPTEEVVRVNTWPRDDDTDDPWTEDLPDPAEGRPRRPWERET